MNGLSHKQARRYMQSDLDGLLSDAQRLDLETHLAGCEACRAEAQSLSTLTSRLQSEFHERWDAQDSPSQNVLINVRSQTRRIAMSNKINWGLRALAGIAVLLVLGFGLNFVISQLQSHSTAANGTETPNNISPVSVVQADGQWIAFMMEKDGNMDIYAIRADGSALTNLTNDSGFDASNVWSPDGARIAFVSDRDGNENIYVMNMDGSGLIQLTDDPGSNTAPLWSPDGTKLAYQSRDINGNIANIFVVDSNGQNRRKLTNDIQSVFVPSEWSQDGQFIFTIIDDQIVRISIDTGNITPLTVAGLFTLNADGSQIFHLVNCEENSAEFCNTVKTVHIDGTNEETHSSMEIQQVCSSPEVTNYYMTKWSPDRTKILFAFYCEGNGGSFYIANVDGSDFKPLTNYPILGKGGGFDWSPDSRSIVFTSSFGGGENGLYILNIAETLQNPELRPSRLHPTVANPFFPAWQPEIIEEANVSEEEQIQITNNEGLIAFTSAVEDGNLNIYTVRPDGSELTNLTKNPAHDVNPFWSPDGKRIAFTSDRAGHMQIFTMNADGSDVVQVTNNEADHEFQSFFGDSFNPWSPDGSSLTFIEKTPDGNQLLSRVDVDSGNTVSLVSQPGFYNAISWSPDGDHIAYIVLEPVGDRNVARIHVVDANGDNNINIASLLPEDEDLYSFYSWTREGNIRFAANRYYWENDNAKYAFYEASPDGTTLIELVKTSTPLVDWWEGTTFVRGFTGKELTWLRSDGTFSELKPYENCEVGTEQQYSSLSKRSSTGYVLLGTGCPNGDLWLYWASPDGTNIKQILASPIHTTEGELNDINWSPDSSHVTLTVNSSGITYLYILDVRDALKSPLTPPEPIVIGGGDINYNVSWQPMP